jgi:hypothetical protein
MLLILENIIIYTYGTLVGYELNEDSIGLNLISSGPPKWVEDKYLTPERKAAAAKRREERIKQREEQAVASEFVAEQYYEHHVRLSAISTNYSNITIGSICITT